MCLQSPVCFLHSFPANTQNPALPFLINSVISRKTTAISVFLSSCPHLFVQYMKIYKKENSHLCEYILSLIIFVTYFNIVYNVWKNQEKDLIQMNSLFNLDTPRILLFRRYIWCGISEFAMFNLLHSDCYHRPIRGCTLLLHIENHQRTWFFYQQNVFPFLQNQFKAGNSSDNYFYRSGTLPDGRYLGMQYYWYDTAQLH